MAGSEKPAGAGGTAKAAIAEAGRENIAEKSVLVDDDCA